MAIFGEKKQTQTQKSGLPKSLQSPLIKQLQSILKQKPGSIDPFLTDPAQYKDILGQLGQTAMGDKLSVINVPEVQAYNNSVRQQGEQAFSDEAAQIRSRAAAAGLHATDSPLNTQLGTAAERSSEAIASKILGTNANLYNQERARQQSASSQAITANELPGQLFGQYAQLFRTGQTSQASPKGLLGALLS